MQVKIWGCQKVIKLHRQLTAIQTPPSYTKMWWYIYGGFQYTLGGILGRILPSACHCTTGSTYQGVCWHFNKSQGNGLFNLASELGWILWLRIWQFHFHTLRKWWFYTCWLSPCVKRLFHHCQRQMPRTPSCHTELLQRSLVTADKHDRETSVHRCAVFCKVY